MNILFIADPNSIHDVRWLNHLCVQHNIQCYVISRVSHYKADLNHPSGLSQKIRVLGSVRDPSTIRPWRTLFQAHKIRKMVRQFRIDIFHIVYAEPNALWAMFRSYIGVPVLITTHGTDILRTIPLFFHKKDLLSTFVAWQYRKAFQAADHLTCTSQKQIEVLHKLKIFRPVTLVRTGVDLDMIRSASLNMTSVLGIEKPFVLMPRNMKPIYNHELTLDAIALLDDTVRHDFTFVFVNADTSDKQYLSGIVGKARTIDADIRFFPSFSNLEIISLYKQAALIVMNPVSDGSPVTAMEAMACKTPVILPPLRYDKEVFEGVRSFERWEPNSLCKSIKQALSGHSEQITLQVYADRISKNGNMKVEMNKLKDIYTVLLKR